MWILGLILFVCVHAQEDCVYSPWGPWSECKGTRVCGKYDTPEYFPMEPTVFDDGREAMAFIKKLKLKDVEIKAKCLKDGSCPQHQSIDSAGPQACVDGFAGDNPCRNIDQLSFLNFTDLGYIGDAPLDFQTSGNDMWGWTDPEESEEYAIVGLSGGSSFVRVTDGANPEVLGFLYTTTAGSQWRDMKVVNNHVYIVSEANNHGVQVFDLTRLRGRTADEFEFFEPDTVYDLIGSSHNIVANEETNTLFVVGATQLAFRNTSCDGGLHMIDVSDPKDPTFAGCYSEDGYTHDAQCVIYNGPDARYRGNEICFAFNEDSFTIVDVTNKSNPFMISKTGYEGCRYAHQGWLTEDHEYAFGDDELDEVLTIGEERYTRTYFWNLRDIDNPVLEYVYLSTETSIDHNLYIIGNWIFQANYEAGLRILYFDPETWDLTELGYFDIFPQRTAAIFSGSWSNYPWYNNGAIGVSSIDYGFYMVQPDYDAMLEDLRSGKKYGEETRHRNIIKAKRGVVCSSTERRECEPVPGEC